MEVAYCRDLRTRVSPSCGTTARVVTTWILRNGPPCAGIHFGEDSTRDGKADLSSGWSLQGRPRSTFRVVVYDVAFYVKPHHRVIHCGPVDPRVRHGYSDGAGECQDTRLDLLPDVSRDGHESKLVRRRAVQPGEHTIRDTMVQLAALFSLQASTHSAYQQFTEIEKRIVVMMTSLSAWHDVSLRQEDQAGFSAGCLWAQGGFGACLLPARILAVLRRR